MFVDVKTHIRSLLMAGLSAGAVGCVDTAKQLPLPPSAALSIDAGGVARRTCEQVPLVRQEGSPSSGSARVAFDPGDPRWADLHEACVTQHRLCTTFCLDVVESTVGGPGVGRIAVTECTLGCGEKGEPMLQVGYGSAPATGRRPEGFSLAVASEPGTHAGHYFAACAVLEGASITSFRRLARELAHHGAPAALIARARRAARDEARHFRMVAALAEAHGALRPRLPKVDASTVRPLEKVAHENAAEGCVFETFAAALAAWQAKAAAAADVRSTLSVIADDEAEHAQLAWDVDAWVKTRLDARDVKVLDDVRRDAAANLIAGASSAVDEELMKIAGLPGPRDAKRLALGFVSLWS